MIGAGAKSGRAAEAAAASTAGAEPALAAGALARALGVALLLAGILGAPPLTAGEAPLDSEGQAATAPEKGADTEATAGSKSSPAETGDASEAGGKGGDVFVPTEEISEDFAVSFPVDI